MPLQKGQFNSGIKNLIPAPKGESIWKKYKRNLTCKVCGTMFTSTAPNHKYCGNKCYSEASLVMKKKSTTQCKLCKSEIKYKKINNKETQYCSKQCAGLVKTLNSTGTNYFYKALFYYGTICDICGDKNYKHLVVHHKDKNRKNNTLENLQVLCANCHHCLHFGSGKTRKYRIEKFLTIIKEVPDAIETWKKQIRN